MSNEELTAQQKFFKNTGLRVGDFVINHRTHERGQIYISGVGYVCVRVGEISGRIWSDEFVKDNR